MVGREIPQPRGMRYSAVGCSAVRFWRSTGLAATLMADRRRFVALPAPREVQRVSSFFCSVFVT